MQKKVEGSTKKKIEEENRLDPQVLTWLCVSQDEVLVVE
jgi:ribosomal protein S6